jgi:hypothetical protein
MTSVFKSIFSPDKPKGPDKELLAAQKRTEARLLGKEKEEERKLAARKAVLRGQQGGRIATLFAGTGETGVKKKLGA